MFIDIGNGSDAFQLLLELEKFDPLRVGENGNRLIGEDDVGHTRPSAVADGPGPRPCDGLGREPGQERAVTQRLDRERTNLYGRTIQCDLVPSPSSALGLGAIMPNDSHSETFRHELGARPSFYPQDHIRGPRSPVADRTARYQTPPPAEELTIWDSHAFLIVEIFQILGTPRCGPGTEASPHCDRGILYRWSWPCGS